MAANPGKSLPKTFPTDAELEGTYRFLSNESVVPSALMAPHVRETILRAQRSTSHLAILHDTSEMKLGGEYLRDGLGYLANESQGFYAHVSMLAGYEGTNEQRSPLGVLRHETHFREAPRKKKRAGYITREGDDLESLRWGRAIEETEALIGAGTAIHVCDREADAYLLHSQMQAHGARYVVRSKYDRRSITADGDDTKLWEEARDQNKVLLLREIRISSRNSGQLQTKSKSGKEVLRGSKDKRTPSARKTHPPRFEREAQLQVTASSHLLRKPSVEGRACPEELCVNLVRVVEMNTPAGCVPVEWFLMTNLPIETEADVALVIDTYRLRWLIEEFFKALKTGCAFEKLQLEGRGSILNALAIYLSVAWRLLRLRTLARAEQGVVAADLLTPIQLKLLSHMAHRAKLTPASSARDVLFAVAFLGGHIKNNGDPGWQVIGRGFEDLLQAEIGYLFAISPEKK